MNIKMSEVFESKLTGQRLFKALDDCITASVKWLNQYTYAATAINAYDANQERIACLENQISQLKSENSSMAAYAEQRINMLTRVNNKLREGKS